MIYQEIHRVKKKVFSNSQIEKKLKIARISAIDYLEMRPAQFALFMATLRKRANKLDPYRDYILMWLKEHPDITSAQVYDWLQEKFKVTSVAENTVRNYVNELRDRYHI